MSSTDIPPSTPAPDPAESFLRRLSASSSAPLTARMASPAMDAGYRVLAGSEWDLQKSMPTVANTPDELATTLAALWRQEGFAASEEIVAEFARLAKSLRTDEDFGEQPPAFIYTL